jgi:hypothetical protein
MKIFIVHWIGGDTEEAQGVNIVDAFKRAGYGNCAIRALDYFEEKG